MHRIDVFTGERANEPLRFLRECYHRALIGEGSWSGSNSDELDVEPGQRKTNQQSRRRSSGSHREYDFFRERELIPFDLCRELQRAVDVAKYSERHTAPHSDVSTLLQHCASARTQNRNHREHVHRASIEKRFDSR